MDEGGPFRNRTHESRRIAVPRSDHVDLRSSHGHVEIGPGPGGVSRTPRDVRHASIDDGLLRIVGRRGIASRGREDALHRGVATAPVRIDASILRSTRRRRREGRRDGATNVRDRRHDLFQSDRLRTIVPPSRRRPFVQLVSVHAEAVQVASGIRFDGVFDPQIRPRGRRFTSRGGSPQQSRHLSSTTRECRVRYESSEIYTPPASS
mmetsp:Transcript_54966/g.164653  ORF Transcript_54966/g.164653 Transcript_54966/m.164653 type:complete len:207 (+) Transcript_54966:1184-1804(+)